MLMHLAECEKNHLITMKLYPMKQDLYQGLHMCYEILRDECTNNSPLLGLFPYMSERIQIQVYSYVDLNSHLSHQYIELKCKSNSYSVEKSKVKYSCTLKKSSHMEWSFENKSSAFFCSCFCIFGVDLWEASTLLYFA